MLTNHLVFPENFVWGIATAAAQIGHSFPLGFAASAGRQRRLAQLQLPPDYPRTSCTWLNIMTQSLYWGPRLVAETYGAADIVITENGCGYDNERLIDGEVNDLHRRDYVRNYLRELHRAIGNGIPVRLLPLVIDG